MGFLLFGYDQGVMAGIITAPIFNNDFKQTLASGPNDGESSGQALVHTSADSTSFLVQFTRLRFTELSPPSTRLGASSERSLLSSSLSPSGDGR